MTDPIKTESAERHILPDLIRAFAVLGIVLVNVAYFAFPGEVTYHDGGLRTEADHAAYLGVNALFLFKSYSLFSLMFGAGLAYQMLSAERRGLRFGRQYSRRLIGLLVLGILHVTLAFIGDILIIYAVLGALLFAYRHKSVKSLLRWGIALIILQLVITLALAIGLRAGEIVAPEQMAAGIAEMKSQLPYYHTVYTDGSFADIAAQRWKDWRGYLIFALPIQAPGVLGFFVLGLAGVKSGHLADPHAKIWSTARRYALPLGLILSALGAKFIADAPDPISSEATFAMAMVVFAAPFATLGYIGILAKWAARPDSAVRRFIARAGTATLSIYLLQSLILSLVFNGYGLGLYGQIGAAGCIAIGLATGLVTLIFAGLWRMKFARGPFEVLLRAFTYWGRPNPSQANPSQASPK